MARKKRRLKNADEALMGPKPNYGPHNPMPEKEDLRIKEYRRATNWFYYFENKKNAEIVCQNYAKTHLGFTKKQINNLKKIQGWKYRMGIYPHIEMINNGWVGEPLNQKIFDMIKDKLIKAEREGSKIVKEISNKPKPVIIPPAERTRRKVLDTIYAEYDEIIVEGWFEENYTQKFNLYSRFRGAGLKGNAIEPFRRMISIDYETIKDAYEKTCDQAVEAYAHISKANKKKILNQFEDMFKDMEKLKQSFKAQRIPRAIKRKTSDEQVKNLQYLQECDDSKLASINPVLIPGKSKMWVYNTKQRRLTEYVTTATDGFLIAGTSIKNHDEKESKTATLRKPEDMLPLVLSKTEKQLEKFWKDITTKITSPNGRINKDCIIMRVFE